MESCFSSIEPSSDLLKNNEIHYFLFIKSLVVEDIDMIVLAINI